MFDRRSVIEVGGYRRDTIGEDMELVVRLHRYMRSIRRPYRISFVPDPICWTQAPVDLLSLARQRIRWQRGLLDSLSRNRALVHARNVSRAPVVSFYFHLIFEGFGPLIELAGYIATALAWYFGWLSARAFFTFWAASIGIGLLLSLSGVVLEEVSFRVYPRTHDLVLLLFAAVIESFGYRQLTAFWRVVGVIRFLRHPQNTNWGAMKRSSHSV